jgi:hypothetical protein
VDLVWEAGEDDKACVVFALLACRKSVVFPYLHSVLDCLLPGCVTGLNASFVLFGLEFIATDGRYFKQRSFIELAESELFRLRMQTCERIAKLMIDAVKDDDYLFTQVLLKRSVPLKHPRPFPTCNGLDWQCSISISFPNYSDGRYSVILNDKVVSPASAVEMAIDFHAIRVINAHNFQRCIIALWRGYYHIQYYYDDRLIVGPYRYLTSQRFRDHFDTERIKGQNIPGNPPPKLSAS